MEKIQSEASGKHVTPVSNIFKLGKVGKRKNTRKIESNVKEALRRKLYSSENTTNFQEENACDSPLVIDEDTVQLPEIPDDDMTENCLHKPLVIKDNVELCKFGLGENRYVVAKQFMGKLQVLIREYANGHNGLYPTKKGIALDLEKFKKKSLNCATKT